MQTTSRNTQARQAKSRQKQINTFVVPAWLEPTLETASLCVLPVTLLILLGMIALGLTGNSWFAFKSALQHDQTIASSLTPKAQPFKLQLHLELLRSHVTISIAGNA
jgi:hypothetical protein